jgi:hypothetical protein
MPPKNPCPEKASLIEAYDRSTAVFLVELSKFQSNMGILSREDYDAAHHHIEELRLTARAAHEALTRHIQSHGC